MTDDVRDSIKNQGFIDTVILYFMLLSVREVTKGSTQDDYR